MFIFKNSLSFIILITFLTVIADSFAQPESVEKEDLKKS